MVTRIHTIATALPEYSISTEEAEARLRDVFSALGEDPGMIRQIFGNTGIERRYLARPAAFYLAERGFTARNQAYEETAPRLAIEAARKALAQAQLSPEDVDVVIDTSCTGVMIPAVDVHVANALGMRRDVRRIPLTEAGCAAGATALGIAHDLLPSRREGAVALLLAVELPSLTLQLDDASRANLVSSAIFGDGAAAVVVSSRAPRGPAIEHLAHRPVLLPDSTDVMGFDLRTEGFKIILSQRIPMLVKRHLREEVDAFLEAQGVSLSQLEFFVAHPGGTKVLDNIRDTLNLEEEDVAASRRMLRDYGNLSSASVFYVAKDLLERGEVPAGAFGLMIAMGPGFTIELALLRGAR